MNKQELRDRSNRLIGTRYTRGDKIEGRDHLNRFVGTYDVRRNETRDATNRYVGKGDLLSTLFPAR
jgi:hypothetical protein